MKALSITLAFAMTMIATTSNAFCMRKYMEQKLRDSNSGNVYTQMTTSNATSATKANLGKAKN